MSFTLRTMTAADVPAVAALHVTTFNETHTINNDGPLYSLREAQWRKAFDVEDGTWFGVVIEGDHGELVGFAKGCPHDGGVPGYAGELNKIYLLRRYHRQGLGRRLNPNRVVLRSSSGFRTRGFMTENRKTIERHLHGFGGSDRIVRANDVDICVETFGDRGHAAILLIHGAAASMLAWEDEFCERLAAGSRFVIRYDHRDTGRSVTYGPGVPPYGLRDLMDDAFALLGVFELDRAHVVGRSMGGGIAMLAALEHAERVASITLMATTAGGPGLSPPSAAFLARVQRGGQPDWSDRDAVVDHIVDLLRVFDGGTPHFDAEAVRELVARDVDRTVNIAASQTNHFLIAVNEPIRERLAEIDVPTLVIHGENDPVFPLDHGQALADEIPGAELLVLPETGHLVLSPNWDLVVPAILKHTSHG
ncbi:MAG: alpha/beta fold hydrolase [Longimicrobiales bacterium]